MKIVYMDGADLDRRTTILGSSILTPASSSSKASPGMAMLWLRLVDSVSMQNLIMHANQLSIAASAGCP